MAQCVNLLHVFGRRYRVAFDPAYEPKGRPRHKLDPWCMLLPCRRGVIYPYGERLLAVEVEGRPVTANRLRDLPGLTLIQDGDNFAAFTFDLADFPQVAAMVQPRRRRQLSAQQRQQARERLLARRSSKPAPVFASNHQGESVA